MSDAGSIQKLVPGLEESEAKECANLLSKGGAAVDMLPQEELCQLMKNVNKNLWNQFAAVWKEEDGLLELQKESESRKTSAKANLESLKKSLEFAFQGGKDITPARLRQLKQGYQYAVGSATGVVQSGLAPVEAQISQVISSTETVSKDLQGVSGLLSKVHDSVAKNEDEVVGYIARFVASLQSLQQTTGACVSERSQLLEKAQQNLQGAEQAQQAFVQNRAVQQFVAQIDKGLNSGSSIDATSLQRDSSVLGEGVMKVAAFVEPNENTLQELCLGVVTKRQVIKRSLKEMQSIEQLAWRIGPKVQSAKGQPVMAVSTIGGLQNRVDSARSSASIKSAGNVVPQFDENDEFSRLEAECLVQSENFHGFAKRLQRANQ